MNLTSIWSDPGTVVTVLTTWAGRLPELPAPLLKTGCTMLGAGYQITRTGWKGAFLQVGELSMPALSLTGGRLFPATITRTHRALLSSRAQHPLAPSWEASPSVPPQSVRQNASSPLLLPSPRKHATTRPQPTKYPPRVLPSAPTDLSHATLSTTQYAAVAGPVAGPVGGSEAPKGRGCSEP